MKKIFCIMMLLVTITLSSFYLISCEKSGGIEYYSANKIGKIPYCEEKTITISKHKFDYYNVYSDKNGNFILKDNTSYIINRDIVFGLRFKNDNRVSIYDITVNPMAELKPMCTTYENGDYGYEVNYGFKIQINHEITEVCYDINIGKIGHWC